MGVQSHKFSDIERYVNVVCNTFDESLPKEPAIQNATAVLLEYLPALLEVIRAQAEGSNTKANPQCQTQELICTSPRQCDIQPRSCDTPLQTHLLGPSLEQSACQSTTKASLGKSASKSTTVASVDDVLGFIYKLEQHRSFLQNINPITELVTTSGLSLDDDLMAFIDRSEGKNIGDRLIAALASDVMLERWDAAKESNPSLSERGFADGISLNEAKLRGVLRTARRLRELEKIRKGLSLVVCCERTMIRKFTNATFDLLKNHLQEMDSSSEIHQLAKSAGDFATQKTNFAQYLGSHKRACSTEEQSTDSSFKKLRIEANLGPHAPSSVSQMGNVAQRGKHQNFQSNDSPVWDWNSTPQMEHFPGVAPPMGDFSGYDLSLQMEDFPGIAPPIGDCPGCDLSLQMEDFPGVAPLMGDFPGCDLSLQMEDFPGCDLSLQMGESPGVDRLRGVGLRD